MITLLILIAIGTLLYFKGPAWLEALRSWANKPRQFSDEWLEEPHSI